jgi:hypothetical protein
MHIYRFIALSDTKPKEPARLSTQHGDTRPKHGELLLPT